MVGLVEHSCPHCGKNHFGGPTNICPYCGEDMEINKFRKEMQGRIAKIKIRWVGRGKEGGGIIPSQSDSNASNN